MRMSQTTTTNVSMSRREALGGMAHATIAAFLTLGLGGCMSKNAPVTTEALLARCVAAGDTDNMHATADVTLNVSVGTYRVSMPISLDGVVAGNTIRGRVTADLSTLDVDDYVADYYVEQLDGCVVCYLGTVRDGKTGNWKCVTIDTTGTIDLLVLIDLLRSSELTRVSTSEDPMVCYELSVPTTDVCEVANRLIEEDPDLGALTWDDLMEELKGDKVEVDFSEDCRIRSMSAESMFTYKHSARTPTLTIDVGVRALVDGYGTVSPADVSIPASVRHAAVPTKQPIDMAEILGADNPIVAALPEQ